LFHEEDYNTESEILQDLKNGKTRPWRPKKVRNLVLSDSYKRLGNDKKSSDIKACALTLVYDTNEETLRKYLKNAYFCQKRLCPMCQWRKSIKTFYELSKVMDVTEQRNKDLVPVFLTLTVKNCKGDELPRLISDVLQGWYQLTKHRKMNRIVKGWFRALEVTYDGDKVISKRRYNKRQEEYDRKGIKAGDVNLNYDTFHPHIHAILLVEKGYFTGKDYMHTTEWVQLWRTSAGLDYDPTCDIRKVRKNKGKQKDVADVAKYTLKDMEYIKDDKELTDKLVNILDGALHRRRLYAYGGVLKEVAKDLNVNTKNPDSGDLVHIDDDSIREDIATVVEVYKWNFGAANYFKVRG